MTLQTVSQFALHLVCSLLLLLGHSGEGSVDNRNIQDKKNDQVVKGLGLIRQLASVLLLYTLNSALA
jgi:hypothetical protein